MIFDIYRLFEKNRRSPDDDVFRRGRIRADLVLHPATRTATATLKDGSEGYPYLERYEVKITSKGMVVYGIEVIQYSPESTTHRFRQGWLCKHPGEEVQIKLPGATWLSPGNPPVTWD
jgi:hypothetical protein